MSWGLVATCAILIIAISPLRALVAGMISHLLIPGLTLILSHGGIWLQYLWKMLFQHHRTLFRNLTSPRRVIYRSLESDDEA